MSPCPLRGVPPQCPHDNVPACPEGTKSRVVPPLVPGHCPAVPMSSQGTKSGQCRGSVPLPVCPLHSVPMSPQGTRSGQRPAVPSQCCPCVTVPASHQGTKSESGIPAGARALSHCPCVPSAGVPRSPESTKSRWCPGRCHGSVPLSMCPSTVSPHCPLRA